MAQKRKKPKPQKKKNKNKPKAPKKARPQVSQSRASAKGSSAADHGPVKEIVGMKQFDAQVLGADKPVIVDFWAEWCGPCHAMAPVFKEYAESNEEILFAKVDTERSRDIAEELNIQSLPTFLAFHEGQVIDMKIGVVMPVAFEKWIAKIKKKAGIEAKKEISAPASASDDKSSGSAPEKPRSLGQKIKGWFGGS